jgi:hypothetical protein
MRGSVVAVAVVALLGLTLGTAGAAGTTVVSQAQLDGWAVQTDGTASVAFVNGPAAPPLGSGSVELRVGADGDSDAELRNSDWSGTALTDITTLSYSTYVTQYIDGQAPYLILNVDYTGDGVTDDLLFFEPVYQSGTYGGDAVPNQCGANPSCVVLGAWQTWDARAGGWWSLNAGTFGPPLVTLASYAAAHPGAQIVNSTTGGGLRVVAGGGAGAWDNFIGNADALTINGTTYDFELNATPHSKADCMNNGWRNYSSPRSFKNQGDCIQFVQTGK